MKYDHRLRYNRAGRIKKNSLENFGEYSQIENFIRSSEDLERVC